ncbi:hypothetical protein [Photobacterium aquimaris]|uniref:Uncharacterized protein n=1 Tax=Photobacterium aquimaris TaxID=512643 RepID=A0A1Y6L3Q0_9GAMM|nr:hypothetical protein [Photobacterium aquimaris]SMY18206.1 hypothetical protein PAQU9191_03547 [Photobacterium aquimaris]
MRNLLNMYEWLTLEGAVSYLSGMIGESVSITDLYRLALDGKLILSVRFLTSVPALAGKLVDEVDFFTQTSDENIDEGHCDSSDLWIPIDTFDSSEPVDDDTWFVYEDVAQNINGIWDLTMRGLESVDIEKRYLDEQGECGYNPKRDNEQGVWVQNDTDVRKLLSKLAPSPVYDDKAFIDECIKIFLDSRGIYFDECIDYDFDTLISLLTSSERDHLTAIIDLMSISLPTCKIYKNCLTIEDYSHQIVIKRQELERFIQLLGEKKQEVKPTVQKAYTKNNDKQTYNKAKTQAKYLRWQKHAIKLKKKHPNKTKSWIAAEIAKLPIAEGKSTDTIRKNIKI